jgi:DNA-binding cell septation regulator SpoVG
MNTPARTGLTVEVVDIRLFPIGNLKALATVKVGCFRLHGWRIMQQPNQRAWVSVPQEQDRDGRWHNRLEVTNPAILAAIRAAVFAARAETAR